MDLAIVSLLAWGGILMTPLPMVVRTGVFGAAVGFASRLDAAKLALFRHFQIV
jgi:hypothetical protein